MHPGGKRPDTPNGPPLGSRPRWSSGSRAPSRCSTTGVRWGWGVPSSEPCSRLLLLNANRVVSTDRLIDEIWGEATEGAARTVQVYVSNLRKLLEPGRDPAAEPSVLVTRKPGYVLCLESAQLDLLRFETLLTECRAQLAAGDAKAAASGLREALDLWRGPLLADLAGEPFVVAETARLEHLRLDGLETCFEAELARGRHAEIAAELADRGGSSIRCASACGPSSWSPSTAPGDSPRRCGRAGGCGASWARSWGIEPGAELVRIEEAILMHKPELDWVPASMPELTRAGCPPPCLRGW